MHILMVTLGFYPATAWGGPVKVVYQDSRELIKRGHQVTVYCTNLFDKNHKIQDGTFEKNVDGMRVVYFNTWWLKKWPGTLGPFWVPSLSDYLKKEIEKFDVIHLHGTRNFITLPVAKAARRNSVPFVVQPHGALPVIVNSFWAKRLYDRFLGKQELEGLSGLIALQETEKQQALTRGIPEELIRIIPNGLEPKDLNKLDPPGTFRTQFNIPEDVRLILFLGRINKKKGTDMLIEAFAQIKSENVFLAIVGPDDGQLDEVRNLVTNYNLEDRVCFTGLLDEMASMLAYQDADLFVLPCRVDTFPTTIMESCLMNTPMVITNGCESAYLVEGKVADVVPFDSVQFAAAIDSLLQDEKLYTMYQENCAALFTEAFSIQSTAKRLEALYEEVANGT